MSPRTLLLTLTLLFGAALVAPAHPVAQGAMEVLIRAERIEITARVANEQAMVAEAFAPSDTTSGANDLEAVWKRHGEYLLKHLHVAADEVPLTGRVVGLSPPASAQPTSRISYQLQFDLPSGQPPPGKVVLRQDVLNEIEFAPNNPWEATYVTQIGQDGQTAHAGLLFTSKQPLVFSCNWTAPPNATATTPHLDRSRMFWEYLHHGLMHILVGYDHLLFMAALVLAAVTLWDLVKVVTAFTLAHTLTLTLSVFNVVRLPEHIVEPMIAGSIVIVALQNVFWPERSRGWSRLLIAFAFGLFHGLGFAGGLLEAMESLPGIAVVTAIVAFSIGVELGHQVVVLPLFGAIQLGRASCREALTRDRFVRFATRFGSAAISAAGMFYLVAALR